MRPQPPPPSSSPARRQVQILIIVALCFVVGSFLLFEFHLLHPLKPSAVRSVLKTSRDDEHQQETEQQQPEQQQNEQESEAQEFDLRSVFRFCYRKAVEYRAALRREVHHFVEFTFIDALTLALRHQHLRGGDEWTPCLRTRHVERCSCLNTRDVGSLCGDDPSGQSRCIALPQQNLQQQNGKVKNAKALIELKMQQQQAVVQRNNDNDADVAGENAEVAEERRELLQVEAPEDLFEDVELLSVAKICAKDTFHAVGVVGRNSLSSFLTRSFLGLNSHRRSSHLLSSSSSSTTWKPNMNPILHHNDVRGGVQIFCPFEKHAFNENTNAGDAEVLLALHRQTVKESRAPPLFAAESSHVELVVAACLAMAYELTGGGGGGGGLVSVVFPKTVDSVALKSLIDFDYLLKQFNSLTGNSRRGVFKSEFDDEISADAGGGGGGGAGDVSAVGSNNNQKNNNHDASCRKWIWSYPSSHNPSCCAIDLRDLIFNKSTFAINDKFATAEWKSSLSSSASEFGFSNLPALRNLFHQLFSPGAAAGSELSDEWFRFVFAPLSVIDRLVDLRIDGHPRRDIWQECVENNQNSHTSHNSQNQQQQSLRIRVNPLHFLSSQEFRAPFPKLGQIFDSIRPPALVSEIVEDFKKEMKLKSLKRKQQQQQNQKQRPFRLLGVDLTQSVLRESERLARHDPERLAPIRPVSDFFSLVGELARALDIDAIFVSSPEFVANENSTDEAGAAAAAPPVEGASLCSFDEKATAQSDKILWFCGGDMAARSSGVGGGRRSYVSPLVDRVVIQSADVALIADPFLYTRASFSQRIFDFRCRRRAQSRPARTFSYRLIQLRELHDFVEEC